MKKNVVIILVLLGLGSISTIFVLHLYLLDGIDGWFFSTGSSFEEDTVYASGYSDKSFRKIKKGMNHLEVLDMLGIPLVESWYYENIGEVRARIWFTDDRVVKVYVYDDMELPDIQEGMEKERISDMFGSPTKKSWVYSKSPGDKSYRVRVIILKDDNVAEKIHEFYVV
jgi:outer membrane protein assembly factor BamE (lipoprotein component of BamABCDE complex)